MIYSKKDEGAVCLKGWSKFISSEFALALIFIFFGGPKVAEIKTK